MMGIVALLVLMGVVGLQAGKGPIGGMEMPRAEGFAPVFQTAPFGSADTYTIMYCHYNTNTNCLKSGGSITPTKSNFSISNPGAFNTKSANVTGGGTMGLYPSNNFTMQVGTVEAWVNPTSSVTRRQYLFSADGGKSLNGDKINDLILGETGFNPVPNTSKIFFGAGNGVNVSTPLTFPSFVVRGIVTGDVDGDQEIDMLVNNNGASEVWIFDGPFAAGQALATPDAAHRIAVPSPQGSAMADFDQDGDLDLIIASYAGGAPLYGFENDGTGNFTPMTFSFFGWNAPFEGIDIADFDRDGVLDVVGGSFTTSPVQPSLMLKGTIDGLGNYTLSIADPSLYQVLDTGILGTKATDFDNDGWPDIALANLVTDQVIVWFNDKTGHFPNNTTYRKPFPVTDPFTLTAKDIDNDGYLDIGVAQYKPSGVADNTTSRFLRGPAFTNIKTFNVNNAVSLTIGDMDGDGLNDVAYHSSTGTSCPVYYLNQHGNLKRSATITCQATYGSVNGPGSAVVASVGGSSPYGSSTVQYNDMEIYYDNSDGMVHFVVWDTHGKKYDVSSPFTRNGTFQKWQAEWDFSVGRMRLIIGNPAAGGTDNLVTFPQPIVFENPPSVYSVGTGINNQHSMSGRIDELRISKIERGV